MAFSKRSISKEQRHGFEGRLARIHKGGSNTMGEIQIGPREEIRAGNKAKATNTVRMKRKKTKKKEIGRASGLSLVILSFVFGCLSMFVGQVADFHMFQPGGFVPVDLTATPVAPYLPYAALVFGSFLAILFCWTFHLTTMVRLLATAVGLFVVYEYQTEMMQKAPGVYVSFFSKAYVKETLQSARAQTPTPSA
ncbi:hypothetical protein N9L47_00495 [Rhodobacteraceae bacterium]|nr:hypothetical protein [Paracoccaceae bacterium]